MSALSGFALTHRTVFDHPLFEGDAARLGAWLWLVGKACWKPTPFDISGKIVTLQRGQICVSRSQLAKAWGMSPSAVERFLTRLETEQMIGRATGQGKSVVTICNYDKYQSNNDEPGQATGSNTPPNATRSKTGQATGQASGSPSHSNVIEIPLFEKATGQATGQGPDSHRTTKEQGNKGIIEDTNVSSPPIVPQPKPKVSRATQLPDECESDAATATAIEEPKGSSPRNPPLKKPDGVSDQVWSDWRRVRRSAVTQTSLDRIEKEAAKIGWTLAEAITEAAESGWQGFKAEWVKKDQGNGNGNRAAGFSPRDEGDGFTRAIQRSIDARNAAEFAGEAGRPAAGAGGGDREVRLALPAPDDR